MKILNLTEALEIHEIKDFNILSKKYQFPVVYGFLNKKNGKFYIGSSSSFNKRFRNYYKAFCGKCKFHSELLQRAFNKYKPNGFLLVILSKFKRGTSKEEVLSREQYFLDSLKPFGKKGYNCNLLAKSSFGVKRTNKNIENNRLAQQEILNKAVLKKEDVPLIFSLFYEGESLAALASKFKVTKRSIRILLRRETWYFVKVEKELIEFAKNKLPKITTKKEAALIGKILFENRKSGLSCKRIAEKFNLNPYTVETINSGVAFPFVKEKFCPGKSWIVQPKNAPIEFQYPEIVKDLKESSLRIKDISLKYNVSRMSVSKLRKKIKC